MDGIKNPVKAIRAYCLSCNYTANEVKLHPVTGCPLYPFRFGKNPYRTPRVLIEEQKVASAARLKAWREKYENQT